MDLKRSTQQPSDGAPGLAAGSVIGGRPTPAPGYRPLLEGEVIQPTDEAGNDPRSWTPVPSHWVSQVHCLAVYGQVRRPTTSQGCC
ncbi:hypothetical protein TRE132_38770 [Pseudomonas chlororaphis subsp. aurantiaca]|uniref:hypothetical protein n=1 Tax=Pseudomonas chlororaphis TaxID=587753 RepID=UPI001BF0B1BF|nr:hypothetical protein TRE132_38770 [Pseudomonas chlororaphis subsp. aurantiaca]